MSYTLVLLPVSMGTLRYNNHSFNKDLWSTFYLPGMSTEQNDKNSAWVYVQEVE